MPISKGGWKERGYDDSPPARRPSMRSGLEMLAGRLQNRRNAGYLSDEVRYAIAQWDQIILEDWCAGIKEKDAG